MRRTINSAISISLQAAFTGAFLLLWLAIWPFVRFLPVISTFEVEEAFRETGDLRHA